MGKLFGTDGIRGIANVELDCELAFRVGQAASMILCEATHHKPDFIIGKDTRISSDMLESALVAGLCSTGANVMLAGVIPTPAVAFLVKGKADAGIMISASHNPFEHNGIKIFNSDGFKLSDELEEKIEELVLSDVKIPVKTGAELGIKMDCAADAETYIRHIASSVTGKLGNIRVLVDCSNGAATTTAKRLFGKLSVNATLINDVPDGRNINEKCGSTHIELLAELVKSGGYDIGIAFDGDADRCLLVDEAGNIVDGDRIMAACAMALKREGSLNSNTLVTTVMSNIGLHVYARENGIKIITTAVGDRNVLEEMLRGGYSIGGEQSGHVIFFEYATTGDGQLTAVQFLDIMSKTGATASELVSEVPQYPQVLLNIPVDSREKKEKACMDAVVLKAVEDAEESLKGEGRVLLRPSGTEPLVRVMVEAKDYKTANRIAEEIGGLVKNFNTV